jgi:hypothetical protein
VRSALQRQAVHIHESQVDLVDEGRRLQDVSRRFPPEVAARHATQLVVHQRNQAVECRLVALAPRQKEFRDVLHAGAAGHRIASERRSLDEGKVRCFAHL